MKKILILLIVSFLFVSCTIKLETYYVKDDFYPQNSYYYTDWLYVGGLDLRFYYKNGRQLLEAKFEDDDLMVVDEGDNIIIKFKNGDTLYMKYYERVSDYKGYISSSGSLLSDYYELIAYTPITNISAIDMIRVEYGKYYENNKAGDISNNAFLELYGEFQNAIQGKAYKAIKY